MGYGNQKFGEQTVLTIFGKDFIFFNIKVKFIFKILYNRPAKYTISSKNLINFLGIIYDCKKA